MSQLSNRIEQVSPSVTLEVDLKAKALKASGVDIIGFGAGEPDFPTPDYIVESAMRAAQDTTNHRYTQTSGLLELRQAVADKMRRDSGYEVTPDQVVITNGGKQAVYTAFQILVNPGDEVIVPTPCWVSYPETIKLAGGVPVEVHAGADQRFEPTIEQIEAAYTPRTKAIIVNSPNNPTGAVWSPQTLVDIARWAIEHDVWVISDEIYEHMVYDDVTTEYIGSLVPEVRDRLIVLNGVAKTYAMTGWRVGWLVGSAHVAKAAGKLQGHLTSNVSNVPQRAAITAVAGDLSAVYHMREAFDRRRHAIVEALNSIDGVTCDLPQGAFYAFADFSSWLGKPLGKNATVCRNTVELASLILDEVHVAAVPGEGFGAPGFIRFSYALADEDLDKGMQRLCQWFAQNV